MNPMNEHIMHMLQVCIVIFHLTYDRCHISICSACRNFMTCEECIQNDIRVLKTEAPDFAGYYKYVYGLRKLSLDQELFSLHALRGSHLSLSSTGI